MAFTPVIPDVSFLRHEWQELAGLRHRSDATERPLTSVPQSSTREGPLRIIEPPFLAADRSAVDDPSPHATPSDVAREPDPYPKEVNAMSLDHWQRPTIANMLNGHIPIGELTCKVCLRRGSLYRFP